MTNGSSSRPILTYWQDARIRFQKNKLALFSVYYLIFLGFCALILPNILKHHYGEQSVWYTLGSPTQGLDAYVLSDDDLKSNVKLDASFTPKDIFEVLPSPKNIALIGIPSTHQIHLSWEPVLGVKSYKVYRSLEKDNLGIPLVELKPQFLSFKDQVSLRVGENYFYNILANNGIADSTELQNFIVKPKLGLIISDAEKINPTVKIGDYFRTKAHWFGTDYLGRDTLTRLMVGARVSLLIGLLAPFLYVILGVFFGAISGFVGGITDNVMMRFADLMTTIPELLIVILFQVALGSGPVTLIIAMTIASWSRIAIQIRGEVLRLREMEYIAAAKVLGTSFFATILKHIVPNIMGTILVLFSLEIPRAIFTESFLSFIGLGIAPPMPSWGTMTREGAKVFASFPLQLFFPAFVMSVTMFSFNFIGDGLRDALDSKLRDGK